MIKKSAKQGLPCWKLIDSDFWCYEVLWQGDVSSILENDTKLSNKMIDIIQDRLDSTITVAIDAGACGSLEVAKQLANDGNKFVISCSSNRPAWLWKWMKENIEIFGDYSYSKSEKLGITAICWVCNATNKTFNILTNIDDATDSITVQSSSILCNLP